MGKKINWDDKPLVRFGRQAEKFDRAIVGVSDDNNRYVYNINAILASFIADDGMSPEEADNAFFAETIAWRQENDSKSVRHTYEPIMVRLGADSIQTARQLAEDEV